MSGALSGGTGEIKMTVEIIRKDTGLTETHQLVGFVSHDDFQKFMDASKQLEDSQNAGRSNS